MKKTLLNLSLLLPLVASPVHAISTKAYTGQTVGSIISKVVDWVLGFAGAIAVLFIIYGGILYITSAGNDARQKQAKTTLTYAVIGVVVIVLSRFIVNFVASNLTGTTIF